MVHSPLHETTLPHSEDANAFRSIAEVPPQDRGAWMDKLIGLENTLAKDLREGELQEHLGEAALQDLEKKKSQLAALNTLHEVSVRALCWVSMAGSCSGKVDVCTIFGLGSQPHSKQLV